MSLRTMLRRTAVAIPVVIAALAVTPAQAAPPPTSPGDVSPMIVGGGAATQDYSFMTSLQINAHHGCGGSLINSQWVVTAAHCVAGQSAGQFQLRIGSRSRSSGGTLARVSQIVQHPNYRGDVSGGYDIALMRLSQAVSNAPVTISSSGPAVNTATRLLGWGQTCPQQGCDQGPDGLKQLDTRLLSDSSCRSIAQPGSELCFYGTTSATACYGDSGGPALVQVNGGWQLVGATSRSGGQNSTCGAGTDNVVYTDVTAYQQWIQGVVGGGGGDPGNPCQARAWRPGINYPPGSVVAFQNVEWQAQYWSYGEAPGQGWAWAPVREC